MKSDDAVIAAKVELTVTPFAENILLEFGDRQPLMIIQVAVLARPGIEPR